MRGLIRKLPPFAPDYSGVNGVLGNMGGISLIGGADGCIGNVTGYDDPRFFEGNKIFSSGLRNIRAITGDEGVMKEKIDDLKLEEDIPFILVLSTPTSAVIASDYKGLGKIISKEKEIPVITVSTTGMESYEVGIEKGLYELGKKFIKPFEGDREGVNIIGCTPLDYWGEHQIENIRCAIEKNGNKINSFWSVKGGINEIEKTLKGAVNLVVSTGGVKIAKYLEKEYGIPYVVDVPVGEIHSEILASVLSSEKLTRSYLDKGEKKSQKVLIGEQVWANGFRKYMKYEHGFEKVKVASYFKMLTEYMLEGDVKMDTEKELEQLIREYEPDIVVGDPFYKSFLNTSKDVEFLEVPHLAVSSRLYSNHKINYDGEKIEVI
jgi:nitrogenase molybdenum-iron protein alpha/beta subunit